MSYITLHDIKTVYRNTLCPRQSVNLKLPPYPMPVMAETTKRDQENGELMVKTTERKEENRELMVETTEKSRNR